MYKTLDDSMQETVIKSRLQEVEQQHLQYTLNLEIAQAWSDDMPGKDNNIKLATMQQAQAQSAMDILQPQLQEFEDKRKAAADAAAKKAADTKTS